jgi:hypothetical protein
MPSHRLRAIRLISHWFFAVAAILLLPISIFAQEAAPAANDGGGMMGGIVKTIICYAIVLLGVGIGITAMVFPTKAGMPPPEKKKS